MAIKRIKNSAFYKLMKGTEAVWIVVLPALFVFLGFMNLIPAIVLVVGYILLNLTGYNDKALWQTRDKIVDSAEDVKNSVKELGTKIDDLKEKL